MNDLRFSHLIVALPLFHLISASLYLLGYSIGFGANISIYMGISDVFNTSIRDVIPIYISSLAFPIFLTVFRYATPFPTAQSKIDAIPDGPKRDRGLRDLESIRRALVVAAAIMSVISVGVGIYDYIKGNPFKYIATMVPVIIWIFFFSSYFVRSYGLKGWHFEIISVVAIFIASAFLIGCEKGSFDRHRTYKGSLGSFVTCKSGLIVRKISDHFVVVSRTGQKFLVTSKCEIAFAIPNPK